MTAENPTVAANAVTPDALPLNELTLIGVMHASDRVGALLRTSKGQIAKVTIGDVIGAQTIAAISDDSLILITSDGTQTVLHMPS